AVHVAGEIGVHRLAREVEAVFDGEGQGGPIVEASGEGGDVDTPGKGVAVPGGLDGGDQVGLDTVAEDLTQPFEGQRAGGAVPLHLEAARQLAIEVAGGAVPAERPDLDLHRPVAGEKTWDHRRFRHAEDILRELAADLDAVGHGQSLDGAHLPVR